MHGCDTRDVCFQTSYPKNQVYLQLTACMAYLKNCISCYIYIYICIYIYTYIHIQCMYIYIYTCI